MKIAAVLAFIVSLASSALAQNSTSPQDCPDVLVQNYAWGMLNRTAANTDPKFEAKSGGRPTDTKSNPINVVGNPVNMAGVPTNTDPVRPQGAPHVAKSPVGVGGEMLPNIELRRETYVLVKNSGLKLIKAIHWDFVFFTDPTMGEELKRHKFRSKKKLAPGEVKFLGVYVYQHAASPYQKVIISRVEFADGSIWQRP